VSIAPVWSLLVAAPFIGSFLGVVIRRLPEGRPLAGGRSICEHCGAALAPRDLVPLFSWVALRGRCRRCGAVLGWFYPAVELAALAVAAIAVAADGAPLVWLDCLFGWWLLTLAWIDLRCWLLPDVLTLPLIVAGLAEAAFLDPADLADRTAAAASGYLALWVIAAVYRRLRGREGLGLGDAKLLAAAGAWVGLGALPQVVLLAALVALAAALVMALAGARLQASTALPFGPFLALAAWAIWLFGPLPLA
jgi:leader peptidase (prepilin peptidase) / N-methyltransferase